MPRQPAGQFSELCLCFESEISILFEFVSCFVLSAFLIPTIPLGMAPLVQHPLGQIPKKIKLFSNSLSCGLYWFYVYSGFLLPASFSRILAPFVQYRPRVEALFKILIGRQTRTRHPPATPVIPNEREESAETSSLSDSTSLLFNFCFLL